MDEKEDLSELSQNELCLEKERQSITISIETFEDQLKSEEHENIEIIVDDGESVKSILDSLKNFHSMEIHNSEDESLHSYGSNSIGTFGSNKYFEMAGETVMPRRNSILTWIDSVYELFQEEPEEENNKVEEIDENISYEESQLRIIYLTSFLAFSFALIATVLMGMHLASTGQSKTIILHYEPPKPKLGSRANPYLVLFFQSGHMDFFRLQNNLTLEKVSWSFKVPDNKDDTGHIIRSYLNELHIFYTDGQKGITVLKRDGSDLKHKRIPHSQMPSNFFYDPRFIEVGRQQFWIFGGKARKVSPESEHSEQDDAPTTPLPSFYGDYGNTSLSDEPKTKSLIWNARKHVYYPGPNLPMESIGNGFPVSLNRTVVMILVIDGIPRCIRRWMYSFESFSWTFLAGECIYEIISLREVIFQLDGQVRDGNVTLILNQLKGASYLDKNQVLQILVMYNIDQGIDIVHINGKTFTSTRIDHNFVCSYMTNYPTCK